MVGISKSCEKKILEFPYTMYPEKQINEAIGKQMVVLVKVILANVRDVQSIHLLGGYGRGEGSVLLKNSNVRPLGDYDLFVVTRWPHLALRFKEIEVLQRKFQVQYHIGVDSIWIPLLRFLEKRLYWYEAKFGSRLLYGDAHLLKSIPINDANDINLSEAFSLMFNRLAGLEIVFDPSLEGGYLTEEQKLHLIFQSVKAILACGESLLLLHGKYHFSYNERCIRFLNNPSAFEEYVSMHPDFPKEYEKASSYKLKPSFNMYSDPVKAWFTARDYIVQTLVYFLSRAHGTGKGINKMAPKIISLQIFPELYLHQCKIDLLGFLIYNWNLARKLKLVGNIFKLRKSYSAIVRISLYYLALAIKERGQIDVTMLEKAISTISLILPIKQKLLQEKDPLQRWKLTRKIVLTGWKMARP